MCKGIWIAAGVVAAAAVGTAVWFCMKKREERQEKEELARGVARHAARFDGLYEGIYQGVEREDAAECDAFKEWCGRVAHLDDDERFAQLFAKRFDENMEVGAKYRKQLKALLTIMKKAGVTRREETERVMDPTARREYIFLGEKTPEDGTVCKVLKPAWEYQGRVVEQGIIVAKED